MASGTDAHTQREEEEGEEGEREGDRGTHGAPTRRQLTTRIDKWRRAKGEQQQKKMKQQHQQKKMG